MAGHVAPPRNVDLGADFTLWPLRRYPDEARVNERSLQAVWMSGAHRDSSLSSAVVNVGNAMDGRDKGERRITVGAQLIRIANSCTSRRRGVA
jgi:hypothetical protein